jgi:hypothetical protein
MVRCELVVFEIPSWHAAEDWVALGIQAAMNAYN